MTNHSSDPSSVASHRAPRRSLFSARRFALMASVAAGLGVAVYGFSPSSGTLDLFISPAHAQVNNAVGNAAQPVGFADIVERVKPSVISVKVTMKEKATDTSNSGDDEDSPNQPGSPMERFFQQRAGWHAPGYARSPWRARRHDGSGVRLLHLS